MKINDLEFHLVEVGCAGSVQPVRSLLVRLTTDSGLKGWGEAGSAWRPGELAARRDALLPVLAGRSIFDIEELHTLEALADAPLRCAVEMACWDLIGRVGRPAGVPAAGRRVSAPHPAGRAAVGPAARAIGPRRPRNGRPRLPLPGRQFLGPGGARSANCCTRCARAWATGWNSAWTA